MNRSLGAISSDEIYRDMRALSGIAEALRRNDIPVGYAGKRA